MKVKFTIPGEAKGKGRPRAVTGKDGRIHTYTPQKTVEFENLVKVEYVNQTGGYKFHDDCPLDVRMLVFTSIPKSASKSKKKAMAEHVVRPMKKPDLDNIIKSVLDSLNKIAYDDDSQVVDCQIRKFYSENPKVVISIQEANV